LISAVEGQKHNIVETLLDRGVPPDTGLEKNAVMIAVLHWDTPSLKLLLEFGANPDAPNSSRTTPLQQCNGREEQGKLLLEYGADPNAPTSSWTVLTFALGKYQATFQGLLL
jgi:ankyrin repeat protein